MCTRACDCPSRPSASEPPPHAYFRPPPSPAPPLRSPRVQSAPKRLLLCKSRSAPPAATFPAAFPGWQRLLSKCAPCAAPTATAAHGGASQPSAASPPGACRPQLSPLSSTWASCKCRRAARLSPVGMLLQAVCFCPTALGPETSLPILTHEPSQGVAPFTSLVPAGAPGCLTATLQSGERVGPACRALSPLVWGDPRGSWAAFPGA